MTSTIYIKQYKSPRINENEILRYAGAHQDDAELKGAVDTILVRVLPLLSYKACYTILPVDTTAGVRLGGFDFTSQMLAHRLASSSYVLLFCATVGHGIDREISKLGLSSPADALICNAIGSERVESLCDELCRSVARAEGLAAERAPRYSVGYGDLPLTYQKTIFEILKPEGRIGVTLRDSMLMSPSKTVTAFVPLSVSAEELSDFHRSLSEL